MQFTFYYYDFCCSYSCCGCCLFAPGICLQWQIIREWLQLVSIHFFSCFFFKYLNIYHFILSKSQVYRQVYYYYYFLKNNITNVLQNNATLEADKCINFYIPNHFLLLSTCSLTCLLYLVFFNLTKH